MADNDAEPPATFLSLDVSENVKYLEFGTSGAEIRKVLERIRIDRAKRRLSDGNLGATRREEHPASVIRSMAVELRAAATQADRLARLLEDGGEVSKLGSALVVETSEELIVSLQTVRSFFSLGLSDSLERFNRLIWGRRRTDLVGSLPVTDASVVDVDFYLDGKQDEIDDAYLAILMWLDSLPIEGFIWSPEVLGSVFRRTSIAMTSEALNKAAEALKAAAVDLPQSQANSANASAVSVMLNAVCDLPNAVLRFDKTLIIKLTMDGSPVAVVNSLTRQQMVAIESNPDWLLEPQTLLQRLSIVGNSEDGSDTLSIAGDAGE